MRILYVYFLFVLGWFFASPVCLADEENTFGKITVNSKWDQVRGFQSALSFKANPQWDWLNSRISVVLRSPNDDQGYSRCDLGLTFPDITNGFRLNTSCQWNEDYRIFSSGFTYKWRLWKRFTFNCGYAAGRRDAVPGRDNQYLYFSNRGTIGLDYDSSNINYQLDYTYLDKTYPINRRYSSGRQDIMQKVTWRLWKGSYVMLGYDEATGDYPYDLSYSSSFWKAGWVLKGGHQLNRDLHWNWEYYQKEMDQSRERKRHNQQIKQKMTWQIAPSSQLTGQLVLAEKIYTTEIIVDPEETSVDPFEDPKSRNERKIVIQYDREWGKVSLRLGGYSTWLDYYVEDGKNLLNTGFFGSITFDAGDWRLSFKAAPITDSGGANLPCYQLQMNYNP